MSKVELTLYLPEFEGHGERHRLEGRAHLVDADIHAVDLVVGQGIDRVVRVEIRHRDQRDHLSGLDVEDHRGAGLGLEVLDALGELVADRELRAQVDGELDRLQVGLLRDEAEIVQGLVALVVDVLLHTGDADIVEVGRADDVGGGDPVRIDALVVGQEADAGDAEAVNLRLLLGRQLALDPDEADALLARLLRELGAQLRGVQLGQHGGEEFDRLVLVVDVAGLGEDRDGTDVGGEDLAVSVDDVGPDRGGGCGRHPMLLARRRAEDRDREELAR